MNDPLDRDSVYRTTALTCAVKRAGQDGGIRGEDVDVLGLAEVYYSWLTGKGETLKPETEFLKSD